jgi:phage/plasmid-like protein (TIGR03299 family)
MGYDQNGVLGGVTSGAFRVAPWHGLGESVNSKGEVVGLKTQISDSVRTGDELLVTAGLNWQVEKRTLAELGLTQQNADQHAAIIRTDKQSILGMHSNKYGTVQNEVLGQYTDVIMQARGDAQPVSAVELWGGQVIFLVIEFRDMVKVVRKDGDETDKMTRYMGLYTSHDGTYPLAVKYMSNLWVCQNTFTPWSADTGFTIRHTRNASDIATAAIKSLEGMMTSFDQFDLEINRLLDIEADKRMLTQRVIPAVIGSRPSEAGRSQTMYDTAWDGIVAEWNEKTRGETAFDAVMAVQGYEQHRSVVRNNSRDVAAIRRLLRDDFPLTAKAVSTFA